jgi:hypothetical protein
MLYHLSTSLHPVLIVGALMVSLLFIGITSAKEKKHDPERA